MTLHVRITKLMKALSFNWDTENFLHLFEKEENLEERNSVKFLSENIDYNR